MSKEPFFLLTWIIIYTLKNNTTFGKHIFTFKSVAIYKELNKFKITFKKHKY